MSYSIFILPEDDITVVGSTSGAGLDGVSQGDGSHLVGATITLNTSAWQEIEISDGDPDFADNDGGQRTINSETVNGITYRANTVVEAEFSLVATTDPNDPNAPTFTLVAFNFRSGGGNPFGTIEGLAFIGPTGAFPPQGVPLTVLSAAEGPSFAAADYVDPICFVTGTLIETPAGARPVETLAVGDLVSTRETAAMPILWIGRSQFKGIGAHAPIEFQTGAIGNTRPLRLSRQHRLRITGWRAELWFGEEAVWVPAAHFVNGTTVTQAPTPWVTYHHILLQGHRTLYAEGVEAESFLPGRSSLAALGPAARADLLAHCPDLAARAGFTLAHPALRQTEARVLLTA